MQNWKLWCLNIMVFNAKSASHPTAVQAQGVASATFCIEISKFCIFEEILKSIDLHWKSMCELRFYWKFTKIVALRAMFQYEPSCTCMLHVPHVAVDNTSFVEFVRCFVFVDFFLITWCEALLWKVWTQLPEGRTRAAWQNEYRNAAFWAPVRSEMHRLLIWQVF